MLHSMILSLVPHSYRMHRGTAIMATVMGTGRRRLPRLASASAASCTPAAGLPPSEVLRQCITPMHHDLPTISPTVCGLRHLFLNVRFLFFNGPQAAGHGPALAAGGNQHGAEGAPIVEGDSPIKMVSFALMKSVPPLNRLEASLLRGLVSV